MHSVTHHAFAYHIKYHLYLYHTAGISQRALASRLVNCVLGKLSVSHPSACLTSVQCPGSSRRGGEHRPAVRLTPRAAGSPGGVWAVLPRQPGSTATPGGLLPQQLPGVHRRVPGTLLQDGQPGVPAGTTERQVKGQIDTAALGLDGEFVVWSSHVVVCLFVKLVCKIEYKSKYKV